MRATVQKTEKINEKAPEARANLTTDAEGTLSIDLAVYSGKAAAPGKVWLIQVSTNIKHPYFRYPFCTFRVHQGSSANNHLIKINFGK